MNSKLNFTIFLIIYTISVRSQSVVPSNPCYKMFSYEKENERYYGKITIPSDFKTPNIIKLYVMFYLPKIFIKHNYGGIQRMNHRWQDICKNVYENGEIHFRIEFPIQKPLPVLSRIIINDIELCTGKEELIYGTKIWHRYYLKYWCPSMNKLINNQTIVPKINMSNKPLIRKESETVEFPISEVVTLGTVFINESNENDEEIKTKSVMPKILPTYNKQINEERSTTLPKNTMETTFEIIQVVHNKPNLMTEIIRGLSNIENTNNSDITDTNIQNSTQNEQSQEFKIIDVYSENSEKPNKDNIEKFNFSKDNICGDVSIIAPLITGGLATQKKLFPWLASIFYKGSLICAGNLISNRHILTAAHCLYEKNIEESVLYIKLGQINSINKKFGEISINVKSVNIHPDYKIENTNSPDADIAIITLDRKVEFSSVILPICLYNETKNITDLVGQLATIAGWGRTENILESGPELKKTIVKIISPEKCISTYPDLSQSRSFCAGAEEQGPCHGDSGGGLFLKNEGRWFIKGIISSATGAENEDPHCETFDASLYTDVTLFIDWIHSFTNI